MRFRNARELEEFAQVFADVERLPSASPGDRLTLASASDCESADVVVRHGCWSS